MIKIKWLLYLQLPIAALLIGTVLFVGPLEGPAAVYMGLMFQRESLLAGPPIPWDEPDYLQRPLEAHRGFNVTSNSPRLIWWTNRLVNGVAIEGLPAIAGAPVYPQMVVFLNFDGEDYYLVLGRASISSAVVGLSEAMLAPESDQREVLATLAHEVMHLQHPVFWDDSLAAGAPEGWTETLTQVASLELLSGQCRMGWALACRSVHRELRNWARLWLEQWTYRHFGRPGMNAIRILLGQDMVRADKWDRFWANDWDRRMAIREKYGLAPLRIVLGLRGCRTDRYEDPFTGITLTLDDLCRELPPF